MWELWLNHHEQSDKELLFVVLLNNNFAWDFIADKLRYIPKNKKTLERKDKQKTLEQQDWTNLVPFYPILCDNPYLHRYDSGLAEIYELENFMTAEECDFFADKINKSLKPSTVTDPHADKNVRTSKSSILNPEDCPFNKALHDRMHKLMRIPSHCSEDIQGHVYEVGEEFKPHFDFFDFKNEYNKKYQDKGQRLWTLMVYLHEPEEGGATSFIELKTDFQPIKGKAIIWRNCYPNKLGNPYTLHAGMPVLKGKKIILTKWFTEYKELK